MRLRRRHLLYVLAALAVPLPASAVVAGGASSTPSLSVSATLDSCGVASTTVVCKLDATFAPIDGARYYTAAVTGPDGSVVDYGNVPSGAASLWVPYVGNGTYTVTVSAWGDPAGYGLKPKPLDTDTASAGDGGGAVSGTSTPGNDRQASSTGKASSSSAHTVAADHVGAAPGASSSQHSDSAAVTGSDPGTYDPTTCVPIPATPPPPSQPDAPPSDPASSSGSIDGVSSGDAQAMESQGVLPTGTTTPDCPDPQTTPDGSCCPTPAG